jgi:hypothetical protein
MARKTFFSFKYDDVQKAMTIRNSWVAQGRESAGFVDMADFEEVKKKGVTAINNWIDKQLNGTSVTVVLIGENTSDSKYVRYEIKKSIEIKNGLVAIFINNIKDFNGNKSTKGTNPFVKYFGFTPSKNPSYPCCTYYDWINDDGYNNMGNWIEKAAKDAGR